MIFQLTDELIFPPVEQATEEGILAVYGDLSVERLLLAYRQGIFPWFSEGEPIIWWSPDPRMVLFPDKLHVSKSLQRLVAGKRFQVTFDQCFSEVIRQCAKAPRNDQPGTWITKEMMTAYGRLHEKGHAHSVEVWQQDQLVGGLYGVTVGACFCGESMFSQVSNASKVALVHLVKRLQQQQFQLIDCQMHTPHLESLGAELLPRSQYIELLRKLTDIKYVGQPIVGNRATGQT